MRPGRGDSAQYASDGTALLLTGVAVALLFAAGHQLRETLVPRAKSERAIELTVQLAPPETPPAPPPPLPPPRVKMRRTVAPPARVTPPDPLPVENAPAAVDAVPLAAAAPAPAPAAETHPDLEAQYAAELRADIDWRTQPPDSARYRLQRPSGEVRVRFVVLRSGETQAVVLLRSSGSPLLDEQALKIVSAGHYPAMPAKAFVGEAQHPFVVTIEFRPPS